MKKILPHPIGKSIRCGSFFTELPNILGRRMYVDPDRLPLIIVTSGCLVGIYAASGYNVGTGDMLLRLM